MEPNLQIVDGGLVDFRRGTLQQLLDQLPGCVEVTSQKLAFRTFQPQAKRQLVLIAPVPFVQQRHAGRKILARRRIGRGRFGLSPGSQVNCGYMYFLVVIDQ